MIFGFPRAQLIDGLGFEQTDDRLGQRIVIAVTNAASRGHTVALTGIRLMLLGPDA